MGKFKVRSEKEQQLEARMARLGIKESDLEEHFIRGSGAGGQKINKTSICVYLHHRPSGIEVRCQAERSQALNRFLARRQLCEQLEAKILGVETAKTREIRRIQKQKQRRSRKAKQRMLADKKHHSRRKQSRSRPGNSED